MSGGQRTDYGNWFPPSTALVLWIEVTLLARQQHLCLLDHLLSRLPSRA